MCVAAGPPTNGNNDTTLWRLENLRSTAYSERHHAQANGQDDLVQAWDEKIAKLNEDIAAHHGWTPAEKEPGE